MTQKEKQLDRECNSLSALCSVQLTKIEKLKKKIARLERRIVTLENKLKLADLAGVK